MIVVANTTPLNYLVQIREEHILPSLFGQIIAPNSVALELSRPAAPGDVRGWIAHAPPWLVVRQAPPREDLSHLGAGEREALALATELNAQLVLMDESRGRRIAVTSGLKVAGTVGILAEPARLRLVDFAAAITRLRCTNFYLSNEVVEAAERRLRDFKE